MPLQSFADQQILPLGHTALASADGFGAARIVLDLSSTIVRRGCKISNLSNDDCFVVDMVDVVINVPHGFFVGGVVVVDDT